MVGECRRGTATGSAPPPGCCPGPIAQRGAWSAGLAGWSWRVRPPQSPQRIKCERDGSWVVLRDGRLRVAAQNMACMERVASSATARGAEAVARTEPASTALRYLSIDSPGAQASRLEPGRWSLESVDRGAWCVWSWTSGGWSWRRTGRGVKTIFNLECCLMGLRTPARPARSRRRSRRAARRLRRSGRPRRSG